MSVHAILIEMFVMIRSSLLMGAWKQVNIHFIVHKYSKNIAIDVMKDIWWQMSVYEEYECNCFPKVSRRRAMESRCRFFPQEGFQRDYQLCFENKIKFSMDSFLFGAKFINSIHSRKISKKIMEECRNHGGQKISSYINVSWWFYSFWGFCENTESVHPGRCKCVGYKLCERCLGKWTYGSLEK